MIATSGPTRKQGPVRGCLLPILTVVLVIAGCYGFCMVLFLLQPESVRGIF